MNNNVTTEAWAESSNRGTDHQAETLRLFQDNIPIKKNVDSSPMQVIQGSTESRLDILYSFLQPALWKQRLSVNYIIASYREKGSSFSIVVEERDKRDSARRVCNRLVEPEALNLLSSKEVSKYTIQNDSTQCLQTC